MSLIPLFAVARGEPLLLLNANVVDPVERTIRKGDLSLSDGVIKSVDAPGTARLRTPSARTIDLNGRWVVPGFIDAHVHLWGNRAPNGALQVLGLENAGKLLLESGITAYLDLFNDEREIFALRDKQRSSGLAGADIYAAGPCLTAPNAHCTEMPTPTRIVESPAGAAAEVRELAKMRPDVIKLVYDHAIPFFPTMDKATMESLVKEASRLKLRTVTHIGSWNDAKEAVEAGTTALTHLFCDDVIPDELVSLIVTRGTVMIPTMVVGNDLSEIIDNPALLDDPLLKRMVTDAVRDGYRNVDRQAPLLKFFLEFQKKCRKTNAASLKKLADAGVVLLAGTDTGNFGTFVGYSIHREMDSFVKSGLSAWQALQSATSLPARFLDRRTGVKPGEIADLVVLEGSPIADIANTKKISLVIQRGKVVVNRMPLSSDSRR